MPDNLLNKKQMVYNQIVMMEKAKFNLVDKSLSVNIPVQSIDEDSRIVSGWATIDNIDQTGDVVTAEASLKAFAQFRGNIREMHDEKKAVGKLVQFEQREYFHDDEVFTGIWVSVYISKGAQDTWEKILDGTLTGFSIGAVVPDSGIAIQYVPDLQKMVRFITEYILVELTLADSPANELCDIVSIKKTLDGNYEMSGMLTEMSIENVFWCEQDSVAMISKTETLDCGLCRASMENVGWYEEGGDAATEIRKVLESSNKISQEANVTKGGSEMSDETREQEVVTEEVVAEEATVEEAPAVEEVTEVTEKVEEVATVDAEEETPEVEAADEPDLANISRVLDEIKASLERTATDGAETELAISKVREAVEGVESRVEERLEEILNKHVSLSEEFKSFKEGLNSVEKRLESVEGMTAVTKSASVANLQQEEKQSTSFWSSSILPSFDQ
jgi:putative serine protease XkdF